MPRGSVEPHEHRDVDADRVGRQGEELRVDRVFRFVAPITITFSRPSTPSISAGCGTTVDSISEDTLVRS